MVFLDEACRLLKSRASSLEEKLSEYVPRVLIRGDISPADATYARGFYRFLPSSEQQAFEDTKLATLVRTVVIGDAGSGKSFIIRRAFIESIQRFLDSPTDTPVPFLLDLGQDLIADQDITMALDHWYDGLFTRTVAEHDSGCVLFLDSLDEKLLKVPDEIGFINAIDLFLSTHKNCLSSVMLACRRAFWNSTWFGRSEPTFEVFHADHLDFTDYRYIIPDQEQRRGFFERAESLGIAELLQSPFVGFDLARTYKCGEPLPSSRREWFEGQVEKLLRGRQKDRQYDDVPPLKHLVFLARQLACLATWSTHSSWTITEAVDQLGEAFSLKDRPHITRKSVEILLQRPLFTRTSDRFSFSHQLFREYLAADALISLPIRKQRQFLTAPEPSLQNRILLPLRGVAVALAEASPPFADFLLITDPFVAFLAEATTPSTDYDERLLKTVIDNAIESGRVYWKPIPPRGDRLDRALHKHRPKNVVPFLQPYLDRPDEMTRLWATACSKAWGGTLELNETLVKLAYDEEQNIEIRKNAIDAILASQCVEDIRKLYGLFRCQDDQIRGHTLIAYRVTENPSPREYIEKLCGGTFDDRLFSILQRETMEYGTQLATTSELSEAFCAVDEQYGRLGNLRPLLLEGLVGRALGLGFDDIPPSLFIKIWADHTDSRSRAYRDNLKRILSTSPALYARVWHYALALLGKDSGGRWYWWNGLAEACTDSIFDLLPPDPTTLNDGQRQLVQEVLSHHFHRDPTIERLRQFKALAPEYAKHLRIPKSAMVRDGRDRLEEASKIAQALNREELTAPQRTRLVLSTIGEILHGQEMTGWLEPKEVIQFLSELQGPLRYRTLSNFLGCVQEVTYSRAEDRGPNTFTMTLPIYAVPFWVLWKLGFSRFITAEKLDEFIRCYAFLGTPIAFDISAYFPLLDRLHELSPQQWEECLFWLIEFPHVSLYGPLEYLIQRDSGIYLEQCRCHLMECDFSSPDLKPLFDYWQAFESPDFQQTLRQCYECLEERKDDEYLPVQRFRILWHLLSRDDDWAWEELEKRVEAKTAPTSAHNLDLPASEHLPRNTKRLSAVVNWFTLVRQTQGSAENWRDDLGRILLQTIVDIGGEDAIRELERLRKEHTFPHAEWLGHSIIDIQDRMLAGFSQYIQPGQLLDFVNREAMGIVHVERDLFEWVCQAIEDEKTSLEQGEQVGGYWKDDEPQTEPICQNIMWPAVKRRLSNLGIVGVEERYVGPNKVDLWVVKVDEHNQHLEVFLELKTAREGYSHDKLIDPLEKQLWRKYLKPAAKRFGIYVVLWFKDEDRYPYPTDWSAKEEFEQELRDYHAILTVKHEVQVAYYIIDMTASIRKY